MHACLRGPNNLISNSSSIYNLKDEIAEPRPGMNIKIAAFTVSDKSFNI